MRMTRAGKIQVGVGKRDQSENVYISTWTRLWRTTGADVLSRAVGVLGTPVILSKASLPRSTIDDHYPII
jgi:hypothetical protein